MCNGHEIFFVPKKYKEPNFYKKVTINFDYRCHEL